MRIGSQQIVRVAVRRRLEKPGFQQPLRLPCDSIKHGPEQFVGHIRGRIVIGFSAGGPGQLDGLPISSKIVSAMLASFQVRLKPGSNIGWLRPRNVLIEELDELPASQIRHRQTPHPTILSAPFERDAAWS